MRIVRKHLATKGLTTRIHGSTGRTPQWNSKILVNETVKERVKTFLENYAEKHGSPNPNNTIISLPSEMSYKSVHHDFVTSLKEDDELKSLEYYIFLKLWHQLTPHIQFLSPRTDLCDTCHKFRNELHSCSVPTTKEVIKKNLLNTEEEPN